MRREDDDVGSQERPRASVVEPPDHGPSARRRGVTAGDRLLRMRETIAWNVPARRQERAEEDGGARPFPDGKPSHVFRALAVPTTIPTSKGRFDQYFPMASFR